MMVNRERRVTTGHLWNGKTNISTFLMGRFCTRDLQRSCHGSDALLVRTSSVLNAPVLLSSVCICVLFPGQVRMFVLDQQVWRTTSSFCCVHRLFVHFLPKQTPSWSLNSHCSAATHTVSSLSPPGTCVCALEAVSWQLPLWAATAGSCSSPLLPFLCWCAAWIAATFTPGRLDSRCCGKPRGICSYSTRSTTCTSLCAWGTELCTVHGGYCW